MWRTNEMKSHLAVCRESAVQWSRSMNNHRQNTPEQHAMTTTTMMDLDRTFKQTHTHCIAVNGSIPWNSYRVSLAIWDHTVLPATRHKWTHPALTPAMQAGTRFTHPGGMEGWVDLGDLIAPRPGVEPATFRSRVQRSTNATTKTYIHTAGQTHDLQDISLTVRQGEPKYIHSRNTRWTKIYTLTHTVNQNTVK